MLTNGEHGVIMLSNPRDISVLRRWMAHFGKDILITAWLFRLLIGGVSRVRAGVKWSLRNSRYIKLLQKSRVATYRWRQNVMTLVRKIDKNNGKTENTLYAGVEKLCNLSDADANDMVQKNIVNEFGAVDAKFVYIETYEF